MCKKIPISILSLHDASLVGFHEFLFSVTELLFFLIRPPNVFRALHHYCPTLRLNLAEEMIISIFDLKKLTGLAALGLVDDFIRFFYKIFSIRSELKKVDFI